MAMLGSFEARVHEAASAGLSAWLSLDFDGWRRYLEVHYSSHTFEVVVRLVAFSGTESKRCYYNVAFSDYMLQVLDRQDFYRVVSSRMRVAAREIEHLIAREKG